MAAFTLMDVGVGVHVDLTQLQKDLETARLITFRAGQRMDALRQRRTADIQKKEIMQMQRLGKTREFNSANALRSAQAHNRLLDIAHSKNMRTVSTLRSIGIVATMVGVAMLAFTTKAVSGYAEFEMAMRKATAVSNVSVNQFQTMSDMAENMAVKLNLAATDTASAFYYLGSAGLSVKEQMETFDATITLAKAATISASQAAEIMVDTLRGFKLPTTEAAAVTDILAHSVISSNMTFEQMGETLSLVSGVAEATNNSLADLSVAIQLMANIGIKGTRAGTTMRRSLLNLAAPSS